MLLNMSILSFFSFEGTFSAKNMHIYAYIMLIEKKPNRMLKSLKSVVSPILFY